MRGAATPVEGYKELVSRRSAGDQVHIVEVAGGTPQENGAEAEGASAEVEGEEDGQ